MIKTICFATKGLVFDGNSLIANALGGSESALIYMARELSLLGNIVYVFCECDHPGIYDGVTYADIKDFDRWINFKFDVLIISRFLQLHPRIQLSNMTIFWMHDIYDVSYADHLHLCDVTFLMSEYQKTLWCKIDPRFSSIIRLTKNGYDEQLCNDIPKLSWFQKKNHYIYASRPERGLKRLLQYIWPKVLELNPEAILHICGYENNMNNKPEWYQAYIKEINDLIDHTPNIQIEGFLPKREYYTLLSSCAYMLYPTDFPEISCINAIEAQAMQCLVITTKGYALTETVKSNTLVTDDDTFLSVLSKFQDENLYDTEVKRAFEIIKAQGYAWSAIAKDWNNYIDNFFTNRFEHNKLGIIKQLVHHSDLLTAQSLDSSIEYIVDRVADPVYQKSKYIHNTEVSKRADRMIGIVSSFVCNKEYTILDLGCNNGIISREILNRCKNAKVIAYDINQISLDDYKSLQSERVEFICDSIDNLKLYDLKADVIIAGELLEHLKYYVKILNDIDDCLNIGGMVLYSTPLGPWSSLNKGEEEHLVHFELPDIMTLFNKHRINQTFILHIVKELVSSRMEILSNIIFGYIKTKSILIQPLTPEYIYNKIVKNRPMLKLSACLIVKDEENNLFRCLNSIKNEVDEIIIVDTGSSDHTKDIASLFTNNIFDYAWDDSFANAKNFALSKATGDWILSIDADEELVGDNIRQYTYSTFVSMYTFTQRQIDNPVEDDQHPVRLFKKGMRFNGSIHEEIVEDSNIKIYVTNLYLRHFGYIGDSEFKLEKLQRNHKILLKDIQTNPGREVNFLYYMRDLLHFYLLQPNHAFVHLAEDTWKFCESKMLNPDYKEKTLQFLNRLREVCIK